MKKCPCKEEGIQENEECYKCYEDAKKEVIYYNKLAGKLFFPNLKRLKWNPITGAKMKKSI